MLTFCSSAQSRGVPLDLNSVCVQTLCACTSVCQAVKASSRLFMWPEGSPRPSPAKLLSFEGRGSLCVRANGRRSSWLRGRFSGFCGNATVLWRSVRLVPLWRGATTKAHSGVWRHRGSPGNQIRLVFHFYRRYDEPSAQRGRSVELNRSLLCCFTQVCLGWIIQIRNRKYKEVIWSGEGFRSDWWEKIPNSGKTWWKNTFILEV